MAAGACLALESQLTAITSIRNELRVGITANSIPFSYTTEGSSAPVGHQVDLANQLARDMGVDVAFRSGDLDSLIQQLAKGDIDIIMAGTPMNAGLAKRVAFTRAWGRTGISPVVPRDAARNYNDWSALRAGNIRIGTSGDAAVAAFIESLALGKRVQIMENSPTAIEALVGGDIDVYLTNTIEASVLGRIDERLAVLFPARVASRRPLASLVRIDDPTWLNYVNTWFTIKQEMGYLDSLSRKWGLVGQQF